MIKKPVKLTLVIDENVIALWISRVIDKLRASGIVIIDRVILLNIPANKVRASFLFRMHRKLERYLFAKWIDFERTKAISEVLNGIPAESISESGNIENTEAIHVDIDPDTDLVLNFSSRHITTAPDRWPRFGIWRYGLDPEIVSDSYIPEYHALVNMESVTHASVFWSPGSHLPESVIFSSWFPADSKSALLNMNQAYSWASVILARLIRSVALFGTDYLQEQKNRFHIPDTNRNGRYQAPGNVKALVNGVRIAFRYLHGKTGYTDRWKWFLLGRFDKDIFPDTAKKYFSLKPAEDRFWADPFVERANGRIYLFVEELLYSTMKGHLSVLELDESGHLLEARRILEKPFHISYPFVFNTENGYFMIPETSKNKTIELYRCESFPDNWTFVMNLMENVVAKDTTLHYQDGRWWMFTALNESDGPSEHVELYLFSSPDFATKDWIPHPLNPLSSDIRNARPGGKLFNHNGILYRPSQDCAIRYGRALNINRVMTLNETSYEEVPHSTTEAAWEKGQKGTHTLNSAGDFSVLDVYTYK